MKTIAFSISLFGILLLLFLINFIEPDKITISETLDLQQNTLVKIEGTLISIVNPTKDFSILTLEDETGKITVVCNCNMEDHLNANLEITGKINYYKKEKQIQANKIEIVI